MTDAYGERVGAACDRCRNQQLNVPSGTRNLGGCPLQVRWDQEDWLLKEWHWRQAGLLTMPPQQTPQWVVDGLRVITACDAAAARWQSYCNDAWQAHQGGARA